MFKMGSFEAELAQQMADNLANNIEIKKKEVVKTAQMVKTTKLERAVDHLNTAAELFEECGFSVTAEALTLIIEKLANKDEDKPEIIEFESLLHKKDKDKEEKDLGDQLIQMESLFDKKKV